MSRKIDLAKLESNVKKFQTIFLKKLSLLHIKQIN